MKVSRPSPALVVAIVALVVALGGTAVATTNVLIRSTGQIKDGAIRGVDIHNGTITSRQLSRSVVKKLSATGVTGSSVGAPAAAAATAVEAHRQNGPDVVNGGEAEIVRLNLAPGKYAVSAKANMAPDVKVTLLDELNRDNRTVPGHCKLDIGGMADYAEGALVTPSSANVLSLSTQLTLSLGQATPATLTCGADAHWRAADASIIAIKVGDVSRSEAS